MDFVDLGFTVLDLLGGAVLAALTWLGAKLAQLITANVRQAYLAQCLVRLDDAVITAVKSIEQTLVARYKELKADGTLDESDKASLKKAAIDAVKAYLGPKGLSLLGWVLGLGSGEVESYIADKVEAAVLDLPEKKAP